MSIDFNDHKRIEGDVVVYHEQKIDDVDCEFGEDSNFIVYMIGAIPPNVVNLNFGKDKFNLTPCEDQPNWHILDVKKLGFGRLQTHLYKCSKGLLQAHFQKEE